MLQAGFEARLLRCAETIELAVTTPGAEPLRRCEAAAQRVLNHRQAVHHQARCSRVGQSLRLLRWLARPEENPVDFAAAVEDYARAGSFVDWARMVLLGGAVLAPLAAQFPVLLLVADGMSLPVLRALAESLVAQGWTEMAPREGVQARVGVAVLPTTVTYSMKARLRAGPCGISRTWIVGVAAKGPSAQARSS